MTDVQRSTERAVLTIALGSPAYIQLACTLARSFRLWHRHSDVKFLLATDRPELVPVDLGWIDVVVVDPARYGRGFSSKLRMDLMTTARSTLFIDADCIIVGALEPVFERFRGRSMSVVGQPVSDGEWFGDVGRRCKMFGVPNIPKFVGAVYYFEGGPVSDAVFSTARSLEPRYDELGMVRLRGMPNEEPLLSLAMAMAGESPVPDDGTIKADAMHFPDALRVNVFAGWAHFRNTSGHRMPTSPDISEARPVIAHFNASFSECLPYTREALRLRQDAAGVPRPLVTLNAWLLRTVPGVATEAAKRVLRPAYRRVFGVRRIGTSQRLLDG